MTSDKENPFVGARHEIFNHLMRTKVLFLPFSGVGGAYCDLYDSELSHSSVLEFVLSVV